LAHFEKKMLSQKRRQREKERRDDAKACSTLHAWIQSSSMSAGKSSYRIFSRKLYGILPIIIIGLS